MPPIIGEEYWARKGAVDLFIWRKFAKSADGRPVLFLVHGSSLSALPSYDLVVPERGSEYSVMDQFAARGFDVWTMDHEGYGRSSRTDGNSDVATGADDLAAAMPIVAAQTGRSRFHFYGQSSGALRAAAFVQQRPENADRLVLDAFVWTGEGSPTLAQRRKQIERWRASNERTIDKDMIRSIFARDKPGTTEPAVVEAVATAQLANGGTVPTGTYLDMCGHLPLIDPTRIECPVLILRGEHDGIAAMPDLLNFFERLPNPDKQFVMLPGSAHVAPFSAGRRRFYHAVYSFLEAPPLIYSTGGIMR